MAYQSFTVSKKIFRYIFQNDESSELRRLAKYNRSAKPYPGSPTLTEAPVSPPVIVKNWSEVRKPPGFRSVVFCPKVSPKTSER